MSRRMMNALAVTEIGKKAELIDMPYPLLDDNSVIIKTAFSGVSIGTEMWIAEGRRQDYGEPPFINGYQASGRIVEVGSNGKDQYKTGDLVTVFCSGSHSEYVKSDLSLVHKLKSEASLKVCSMFVQPSVAANALNMAGVKTGDVVYIAGQGLIGQCAAMISRLRGAYVAASDISADRIERSRAVCTDWMIDASQENALSLFKSKFPSGADISIESTGFESLLDDAMSACKDKGTFIFLGWYPDRASFYFNTPHGKQLNAVFPCFIGDRPVREGVIRMMEAGIMNMLPLLSHEVNWDESESLYNTLFTKQRNEYNGIVIKWG